MKEVAIAIDLGATNLRVALISKKGKIIQKIKIKTPKEGKSGKVITNKLITLAQKIIQFAKQHNYKIPGIGISSIGPLDYKKGEIVNSPNIPFKKVPIIQPLKRKFKLPVYLFNDCTSAVWGEKHFGKGKKFKNIIYITISSGIGGGAIVDNHLLFGREGNAVEIGHFKIDTKYNLLCGCKKGRGHWEGYCSGNNMPRFFKFWLKSQGLNFSNLNFSIKKIKTSKEIFELARKREKIVLKFLKEVGKLNAAGINNVMVAYDPEIIILGGSIVLYNKEFILPYFKPYFEKYLPLPKIIITPLKEDVVLFGSASLVFWPPD
ncbi:MAG: ROK family protein [Candidatus Pacebacteria bacterium]|nr:ROK family protein [Candidatus Paceibacterota bacterium]